MKRIHTFRTKLAGLLMTSMLALAGAAHAADLVLPSEVAATHWKTGYMKEFADEVTKRTGGGVNVKIFPGGQLYSDQDAIAALGTGSVQMVWPVAVRLETIDERVGYMSLPFALSDEQMLNRCYADGLTKVMSDYVEPRNLKVLGFLRASDMMFIFRDREVKRMEDVKGTKIRVTGGKIFQNIMRSLNASPVSMAASEMSTALSQGAIDGIFTSPAGWSEMIGITGKYAWYVPGMSVATYSVAVDKVWFDALPEGHRKAIVDVIDEIAKRQWNDSIQEDKKLIAKMTKQGAVYHVADKAEIQRWRDLAAPGIKSFTDKHSDVTRQIAKLDARCRNDK